MADEQKLGVAGEFDSEAFNKGLQRYIDSLLKAEKTTDAVVNHFNKLGASLDKVIGTSAQLDKAAKDVDTFRKSLGAVSQALPNVKPLNKFFSDVAKGAAVLQPVQSVIRSLASLNRSIVSLSQVPSIPQAVLDSLSALEPVITKLGAIPNLRPVARSLADLGNALQQMQGITDKPLAALDTLTSLGVRFKTITVNAADIRKVSTSISLLSRAMDRFQSVKSIPATAIASLGAIANALRAVSQLSGTAEAANQIARVASAMTRFAGVKAIPTQVIATISAIGNVLSSVSKLSGVGDAAKAIGTIGLSLNRLSNIKAIPAKALASIGAIGNALRSVSSIANVPQLAQGLGRLATSLNRLSTVKPIPPHVIQNLTALVRSLGGIGTGGNIQALIGVTNALTQALTRLTRAQAQAVPQMNSFRSSFTQGVAIGVGAQAVDMFLRLGGAIRDFVSSTLGTITFFERFDLTLKSVIARQLQAEDATLSHAEAFQKAERPARGYQLILEKIAVQSIFSPQQIALAFRTAAAFGLTTDKSLRLTQSLVDFVSITGLGEDALDRISLALSQVSARGKVTGDNVKQLAEAGLPIYDILGKAFDKTKEELLDLQHDGAIPAGQAIQALVTYFEEFEGGAEKVTNTTTGLLAKLKEIRVLAARDIFGEIFKSIQPVLKEVTDFVTSTEFRATIVALGQVIGKNIAKALDDLRSAFRGLVSTISSLSPKTKEIIKTFLIIGVAVVSLTAVIGALTLVVGALVNPFVAITATITGFATLWVTVFNRIETSSSTTISNIGRGFSLLTEQLVRFGSGFVRAFAAGITSTLGVIVQALSIMGSIITGLLRPGSPPKLLPDLDTWGTQAAEVYLSGWTKADFDELNKFGAALASQIRNLVGLGNLDELSAPRRIIGTKQALAQALSDIKSFGAVTENTLQRIFNLTLINRDLLSSYFNSYAALTRATENLKKAQDDLNATMKAYDDQLRPLQKRLQEIQDAQENAEEQKQVARLQRIIANRGANDSRRAAAMLELEQIQVENQIEALEREKTAAEETGSAVVDELQKTLDQAKESLAINEARINDQLEINSLLAEEARIRRQLAEELSKLKDPRIVALEKQIEAYTIQQEFLSNLIDLAHQQYILTQKDSTEAQKKSAELRIQELLLDNQIKKIEAAKLGINLDPLTQIPIVPLDFGVKLEELASSISGAFDEFSGISELDLETPIKDFDKALREAKISIDSFSSSITTTIDNINNALPPFLRFKSTLKGLDVGDVDLSMPESMQAGSKEEGLAPGLKNIGAALTGLAATLTATRVISLLTTLGAVLAGTASVATIIPGLIGLVAAAFVGDWFGFRTGVVEQFNKDWETTKEVFNAIVDAWVGIFTTIKEKGFIGLITEQFGLMKAAFMDFTGFLIQAMPEGLQTFFTETLPEILRIGFEMGAGIIQGIRNFFVNSYIIFSTLFRELILNPIKKYFGIQSPSTLMDTLVGGPAGEGIIGGIIRAIREGVQGVIDTLTGLAQDLFSLETIQIFIDKALGLGKTIVQGIKEGLSDPLGTVKSALEGLLGGMFGAGEEEIESGSPSKRAHRTLGEPIGEGILGGIGSSLSRSALQQLLDDALTVFNLLREKGIVEAIKLQEGVTATFKKLRADSLVEIESLKIGIMAAFNLLTTTIFQQSQSFTEEFVRNIGIMRTLGGQGVTGFKADTVDTFEDLRRILVSESGIIPGITESIVTFFQDMSTAVVEIVANMIVTLTEQLAGEGGLTTTLDTLFAEKGVTLGETFGGGIAQGILNKLEPIKNAALSVIQQALQASMNVLNAQPGVSSSSATPATNAVNSRLGSNTGTSTPVVGGASVTKIYNLNVNSTQSSRGIVRDFGIMEVMGA